MPVRRKKTRAIDKYQEKEYISTEVNSLLHEDQARISPKANTAEINTITHVRNSPAKKANKDRAVFTALKENNKCLAAALGMFSDTFHCVHRQCHYM